LPLAATSWTFSTPATIVTNYSPSSPRPLHGLRVHKSVAAPKLEKYATVTGCGSIVRGLALALQGKLAPAMETMLWHYAKGKPKEHVELSHDAELLALLDAGRLRNATRDPQP
jgi:hypothetical protein